MGYSEREIIGILILASTIIILGFVGYFVLMRYIAMKRLKKEIIDAIVENEIQNESKGKGQMSDSMRKMLPWITVALAGLVIYQIIKKMKR